MTSTNFFAVDLGATSGRTILGKLNNNFIELEEINRFQNPIIQANGHYYWDFLHLYNSIIEGLRKVASQGTAIKSIGIDTWGVDFVCFDRNGEMLGNPYSYRDLHTADAPEKYFEVIPRETVYKTTGIQVMNFNSLFQLATMRRNCSSALSLADKILFMPDALSYMLTGEMVTEYSIASTSQMLDACQQDFSAELLNSLGLAKSNFGKFVFPGTVVGKLSELLQKQTGLGAVPVIAVAGHDTASAVAAVPAENENFAYLSSGTWSLMGIETGKAIITDESFRLNFTNEGGIEGSIRFLKNICGMWLLEQCRREWENEGACYSYPAIVEMSNAAAGFKSIINPDDASFANPPSMTGAIVNYCKKTEQSVPETHAEFVHCIFSSLAARYKEVLAHLQQFAPFKIEKLHVIGGGSQNKLLNQMTADSIGIPVVAGPCEATAIGNIMVQAKGLGLVNSLMEMRAIIKNSIETETFFPSNVK
jgi:rhamnulokinase